MQKFGSDIAPKKIIQLYPAWLIRDHFKISPYIPSGYLATSELQPKNLKKSVSQPMGRGHLLFANYSSIDVYLFVLYYERFYGSEWHFSAENIRLPIILRHLATNGANFDCSPRLWYMSYYEILKNAEV